VLAPPCLSEKSSLFVQNVVFKRCKRESNRENDNKNYNLGSASGNTSITTAIIHLISGHYQRKLTSKTPDLFLVSS
jgi:hypothetical protein